MVILTIQLLGWCWPGGIPFHYTLSVVSVPRVFGSGPFPPVGDMSNLALVNELRNFRTVTQCGYGQNDHPPKAMLKSEQPQNFLHVNIVHAQRCAANYFSPYGF